VKRIEQLEALAALIEETSPEEIATWQGLIARRQNLIDSLASSPIVLDGLARARLGALEQRGRGHIERLEAVRATLRDRLRDLYRDDVLVRAYLALD
jgi:hypothetical protein